MRVHAMKLAAWILLCGVALAGSVMNDGGAGPPDNVALASQWNLRGPGGPEGWRLHRSGSPPARSPGGPVGPTLKRAYAPPHSMHGPKYGHPAAPVRRQHPQKKRYNHAGPPSGLRGPPPPGWKSKRVSVAPPLFGPAPPRKHRGPNKPHKYNRKPYSNYGGPPHKYSPLQKPYKHSSPHKVDSYGNALGGPYGAGSVHADSYSVAPNTIYKLHKVPQTTYGIPHPTQGSPEPPKSVDDAHSGASSSSSFVHVYQVDQSNNGGNGQDVETKTQYSYGHSPSSPILSQSVSSSSTLLSNYPEKHKGKVYDDMANHNPVYNHNSTSSTSSQSSKSGKVGFTPPKQTYGFQPYDDKDHFSLTPSHSFYSVSSQANSQSADDSLTHNYYNEQQNSQKQ
ncbi:Hypothetical protein NTJ_06488 [Nesidiocoris tenuis]|uniref:Uncharacterized protein n=1 Tax=Nesidiocoris tenuis TaxID=355587 RepID=A0ABN7AQF5_9HEMI|nr:Hypothetical protein NTJ_06488 [Nesidiocoris tenuis]